MGNVLELGRAAIENQNENPEPEFDTWDAFWTLYPRRVSKKDAIAAWRKIGTAQHIPILVAVTAWRKIWAAEERALQKIPYPASWLNGECWTDEVPPEFTRATHASQQAIALPDMPRKSGEIPAHVLAQIAKLKAGK